MTWESNLFWAIIGLVGGVVTSFVFFLIERKIKRLTYSKITTQLVSNKLTQIEGLNVFFRNQIIDELNTTEIIFRNVGNEIIEENDFAKADIFRVFTEGEFLLAKNPDDFVSKKNDLSSLKLQSKGTSTFVFKFDYLPCNSSYKLNPLHTGNIKILGTLKKGQFYESGKRSASTNLKAIIVITTLLLLYLADSFLTFASFDLISLKPIYSALLGFCLVYYLAKLLKGSLGYTNMSIQNRGDVVVDIKSTLDK